MREPKPVIRAEVTEKKAEEEGYAQVAKLFYATADAERILEYIVRYANKDKKNVLQTNCIKRQIEELENGNSNGKLRSFKRQNLPKGIAGWEW